MTTGSRACLSIVPPIVFLAVLGANARAVPRVWCVDASAPGNNTGGSWFDAFVDLQDALTVAEAGDEIWVARGTYTPAPPGDAITSFPLKNGVAVFGGFHGTSEGTQSGEWLREQRDWALNETILSGDVGHDDVYGSPVWYIGWDRHTANSAHVVDGSGTDATAILDGFTITAGATGPEGTPAGSPLMYGGGLYNIAGSPTVRHCTFLRNLAAFAHGGAIYNLDSSPTITDCTFIQNWVHLGQGGAIFNTGDSAPRIDRCTFVENRVVGGSGGEAAGGAIANYNALPMTIAHCRFERNRAENFFPSGDIFIARAGAVSSFADGLRVLNSTFIDNTAHAGGGIYTWGETEIISSFFYDNTVFAYDVSGGVSSGGFGGGIASGSAQPDTTTINNCTFIFNHAGEAGGVSTVWNHNSVVTNSILWGNTATGNDVTTKGAQIKGAADIDHSIVQGLFEIIPGEDPPDPENFPGCLDDDPLLIDLPAGDARLSPDSPAINAGDPLYVPPSDAALDLIGRARVMCVLVDMGAYEFGFGDNNCDRDVDLMDYDYWIFCLSGPGEQSPPGMCGQFDDNGDDAIDLRDAAAFQAAFSPAAP